MTFVAIFTLWWLLAIASVHSHVYIRKFTPLLTQVKRLDSGQVKLQFEVRQLKVQVTLQPLPAAIGLAVLESVGEIRLEGSSIEQPSVIFVGESPGAEWTAIGTFQDKIFEGVFRLANDSFYVQSLEHYNLSNSFDYSQFNSVGYWNSDVSNCPADAASEECAVLMHNGTMRRPQTDWWFGVPELERALHAILVAAAELLPASTDTSSLYDEPSSTKMSTTSDSSTTVVTESGTDTTGSTVTTRKTQTTDSSTNSTNRKCTTEVSLENLSELRLRDTLEIKRNYSAELRLHNAPEVRLLNSPEGKQNLMEISHNCTPEIILISEKLSQTHSSSVPASTSYVLQLSSAQTLSQTRMKLNGPIVRELQCSSPECAAEDRSASETVVSPQHGSLRQQESGQNQSQSAMDVRLAINGPRESGQVLEANVHFRLGSARARLSPVRHSHHGQPNQHQHCHTVYFGRPDQARSNHHCQERHHNEHQDLNKLTSNQNGCEFYADPSPPPPVLRDKGRGDFRMTNQFLRHRPVVIGPVVQQAQLPPCELHNHHVFPYLWMPLSRHRARSSGIPAEVMRVPQVPPPNGGQFLQQGQGQNQNQQVPFQSRNLCQNRCSCLNKCSCQSRCSCQNRCNAQCRRPCCCNACSSYAPTPTAQPYTLPPPSTAPPSTTPPSTAPPTTAPPTTAPPPTTPPPTTAPTSNCPCSCQYTCQCPCELHTPTVNISPPYLSPRPPHFPTQPPRPPTPPLLPRPLLPPVHFRNPQQLICNQRNYCCRPSGSCNQGCSCCRPSCSCRCNTPCRPLQGYLHTPTVNWQTAEGPRPTMPSPPSPVMSVNSNITSLPVPVRGQRAPRRHQSMRPFRRLKVQRRQVTMQRPPPAPGNPAVNAKCFVPDCCRPSCCCTCPRPVVCPYPIPPEPTCQPLRPTTAPPTFPPTTAPPPPARCPPLPSLPPPPCATLPPYMPCLQCKLHPAFLNVLAPGIPEQCSFKPLPALLARITLPCRPPCTLPPPTVTAQRTAPTPPTPSIPLIKLTKLVERPPCFQMPPCRVTCCPCQPCCYPQLPATFPPTQPIIHPIPNHPIAGGLFSRLFQHPTVKNPYSKLEQQSSIVQTVTSLSLIPAQPLVTTFITGTGFQTGGVSPVVRLVNSDDPTKTLTLV